MNNEKNYLSMPLAQKTTDPGQRTTDLPFSQQRQLPTKEILSHPDYRFLADNADLSQTIYLTLSGSYAYGTNQEGSDIDLRGVLVEHPRYLYGLGTFEQFEDRGTDTVIFGLKKYITLCVNANPNALELLGTPEDCIVQLTPAGKLLRESTALFFSRRAIGSFGHYASAQLRRLSNALCHDRFSPAEQEGHLAQVFQEQMEHFHRTYQDREEDSLKIYLSQDPEPQLLFDVSLKGYPLRDFAGIYGEIQNILKTYGKMNHRNRKKDDVHLYKHAMHLIRLLRTGEDLLLGKGLITYRRSDQQLFMEIRQGKYTFSEVMEMAEQNQKSFQLAAQQTHLPEKPDIEKIEKLMQDIYLTYG